MKINDDEKIELLLALNDRLDKLNNNADIYTISKINKINKLLEQLEYINGNFSW
ncbi:MAG TPA: hypothetical protein VIK86_02035 [Candidatus Paceibacterota bacterium]